jgi:two-component system, response regulator PdtaR
MKTSQIILIVEDSALILMNAVAMFREAGYRTLEACCAAAAIAILENRGDIDIVFTDVNMPGKMDGLKLAAHIRQQWPPIKLLVASGKAIDEDRDLPIGVSFFQKPYAETAVLDAARQLLLECPSA